MPAINPQSVTSIESGLSENRDVHCFTASDQAAMRAGSATAPPGRAH